MVTNIDPTTTNFGNRTGEFANQNTYARYKFEPGTDSKIMTSPMQTAGFEYAIILWNPDTDGTKLDMDKTSYLAYDKESGIHSIKENPEAGIVIATQSKMGYIGPGFLPANLIIETPCDGTLIVELHNPVRRRLNS